MKFREVIADYLRAAGWEEPEPGRWIPPGARMLRATKKRPSRPSCGAFYSTLAAVETQYTAEMFECAEEYLREIGV